MPYIHFTEEQKQRASSVDLVEFLRRQGEKLLPSGREKRLASDHSITVNGNRWYDHSAQQGGGSISFVQKFYGVGYAEAVNRLLGGEQGETYQPVKRQACEPPKPSQPFVLPEANPDMRRAFAYLTKKRLIGSNVVKAFADSGLLYESCEKFNNMEQHNAVFVGKDEHGVARHAHKRGLSDQPFKRNVIGSDARCSFHHIGTSRRLYVFEAPIDLMSFVTLYQKDWQKHSYVALCGTSEHAMRWMLKQNPKIQRIALCLDHDPAGITAVGRLREILCEKGYHDVVAGLPSCKDWNAELFAACNFSAESAEEHPQMLLAPSVCERIAVLTDKANPKYAAQKIPSLLHGFVRDLQYGNLDRAMERMEAASAFALSVALRERRQLREPVDENQIAAFLQAEIWPNRNQTALKNRADELMSEYQTVMTKTTAQGIRTKPEKEAIAYAWLHLAASCAKAVVKYETDLQYQPQQQQIEMGGEHVLMLILSAGLMILVIGGLAFCSEHYALDNIKSKTVGDGQHGTARWATKKEIQRTYTRVRFQPELWRQGKNLPKKQGLILGCEGPKNKVIALVDTDDIHAMMTAASGAGKTAFFLYPNIEYALASGMSFLCTDTKGDLFRNYAGIAKDCYGYQIAVLDLRNPTRSGGMNLLNLINRYMDIYKAEPDNLPAKAKAEKYAKILAKTLINTSGGDSSQYGQNSFFYDSAEGLLTAMLMLVAEYLPTEDEDGNPIEQRHIVSVFKLVQERLAPSQVKGKNQFQLLLEKLPPDHKAKWFAGSALNTAEQAMASVISTVLSRLNAFLDSEMEVRPEAA